MKNIEFNKTTFLSPYPYISYNFFWFDTVRSYWILKKNTLALGYSFLHAKNPVGDQIDSPTGFVEQPQFHGRYTIIEIRITNILKYPVQILKPYDIITLIKLTGGVIWKLNYRIY